MEDKRIIVFSYSKGWNDTEEEEFEYDLDIPDEEIQKDFEDWVWGLIGDSVNWYEK